MDTATIPEQNNNFPLVFKANGVKSATDLCAWINEQKGSLLKNLQTSGACLLRGADITDGLDFASVVSIYTEIYISTQQRLAYMFR
jgi:hypothetical protein